MEQNTAIITGSSSGIGQAVADGLEAKGWRVVRLTRHSQPAADTHPIDLNDLAATATLGEKLAGELKHLDAFIHIAGIWHDEHGVLADKQLAAFSAEQISATMNVGVTAAMVLGGKLLPKLKGGTFIGVSGTFSDGAAGWLPYYTSKRALEDFLVGLAQDYADVAVFGISPADTATPAYKKYYPQYAAEAQPPTAVSELIEKLLTKNSAFKSGDIVELRQGKTREAFHA